MDDIGGVPFGSVAFKLRPGGVAKSNGQYTCTQITSLKIGLVKR